MNIIFEKSKLDETCKKETKNDTRYIIKSEDSFSFPRNSIGLLKIEYPYKIISYRTGVLIGNNVVLTAGHNLYDSRENPNKNNEELGKPITIEFYPGLNSNKIITSKPSKAKCFYFPKNFPERDTDDYGIIILDDNPGIELGYFTLTIFDEKLVGSNTFFITGYPLNKTTNNNTIFYQYEGKGNIKKIKNKEGILITDIKSSYGQSGSGLWYYDSLKNKYCVVGVHVASSYDDTLFFSTMINNQRYEQINKWIEESKAFI